MIGLQLKNDLMLLYIKHADACGMELPYRINFFNFLFTYIFIFNTISLLFHLFFLYLTKSCPNPHQPMVTAGYMCQPSIPLLLQRVETSSLVIFINVLRFYEDIHLHVLSDLIVVIYDKYKYMSWFYNFTMILWLCDDLLTFWWF